MNLWLVGNPAAGDDQRGVDFWRDRLLEHEVQVDRVIDPGELGRAAIGGGDRVLAAGGDGTVQSVAAVCAEVGAVLAVLPSGTANDFARSLGVPDDPEAACAAVAEDRRVRVDLATVETDSGRRGFVNVAHIGLGAEASRAVDDQDKKWLGPFSYAGRALERWRAHRGTRGELRCDDQVHTGRWLEVGVANGAFYGGGHRVPEAVVDDGWLEVFAVRADHPLRLAWTFVAVRLLGPDRIRSPELVHCRSRSVAFSSRDRAAVTADGESLGETPVTMELHPGALWVVRGPGEGAFSADPREDRESDSECTTEEDPST